MSVICLMLFLTIGVLSAGFGFKNALESGLEKSTPFDASAYIYLYSDEDNIMDSLNHIGVKLDKNDKVVYFNEYIDGTLLSSALHLNDKDMQNMNYDISYVKISDYNAIRKLNNKKPISLKENEVLITSNASKILPLIKDYMKNNNTINLGGNIYNIKNKYVIEESLQTDVAQNNMFTVIMSDNLCNNKEKVSSNVNINFVGGNKEKREENFSNTVQSYNDSNQDYGETPYVHYKTRNLAYEDAKGMTTTILFVGIYIGIVFLISSMAVLALQQLSEASESIERYRSLNRLGANLKSINKTIFVQTLVYFSIPVVLAIVHSIIGIKVANDFILLYGKPNIESACFITGSVFMVVYAIYFYVTYSGYKNIVKNNI